MFSLLAVSATISHDVTVTSTHAVSTCGTRECDCIFCIFTYIFLYRSKQTMSAPAVFLDVTAQASHSARQLPHVGGLSGCWNTMADSKLSVLYYSPRGYWKGLAAIKKLASAAKVTEQGAKDWLKRQAIGRSICLPHGVYRGQSLTNEVHQADLLFLPHNRVGWKTFRYGLTVVDVASRYKEAEPLTSKTAAEAADALSRIYRWGPVKWVRWASCWQSTLSRSGAVGLTSTGTKGS